MKHLYIALLVFIVTIISTESFGQVGIGTTTPDSSSILDINSTTKGVLFPKVALQGLNTTAPLINPAKGLIVWNTGTTWGTAGFYYNDSNAVTPRWLKVASGSVLSNVLGLGKIWIGDSSNIPVERDITGDIAISFSGISSINNNVVNGSKINITGNSNGSMMYYNGTDWVNLSPDTSGKILSTNGSAAPTWSNANAVLTKKDITTTTSGVSITNGTNQVVGDSNVTINIASNSSTSAGLVASGSGENTKIWGTDASGNPSWKTLGILANVQNGLIANTSAPNASVTRPYLELGGTLVRNTTITQGLFNYTQDLTGNGVYRINHNNTTPTTTTTYPFGISRLGITEYTIGSDASYVYQQTWNSKPLQINTQGNNTLINPNSGFVGMGTLSPSEKLHVANSSGDAGIVIDGVSSNQSRLSFRSTGTERAVIYRPGGTSDLRIYGNGLGADIMHINTTSGYIGIGTLGPIQNLDINGRLNVTNGVIQRGSTQITATADLGLYSQVSGNWIRIASNAAPIKFFVDQGGGNSAGTNALMSIDNSNGGGVVIAAQSSGAGNAGAAASSAALEIQSTTKGFLPPRMTTAQRNAIASPQAGLMIYNTDNQCIEWWDANLVNVTNKWNSMCSFCKYSVTISVSTNALDFNSYLLSQGIPRGPFGYCVTINFGVTIGANAPGGSAISFNNMPEGAKIFITNYGRIIGGGGNGGMAASEGNTTTCSSNDNDGGAGSAGGNAIITKANVYVSVTNSGGLIAGGGGGGGGGDAGCCSAGGGGGGGAGSPAGFGGSGRTWQCSSGFICLSCGNTGSSSSGFSGNTPIGVSNASGGVGGANSGTSTSSCSTNFIGNFGGNGGSLGSAGNTPANVPCGSCFDCRNPGAGGAGGKAISGGSGNTLNNVSGGLSYGTVD